MNNIHNTGFDKGASRVVQDVRSLVHTLIVIGRIDSHCLLGHSGLISVSGGLIVVRKWDTRSHHAENGTGVDFTMSESIMMTLVLM